MKGIDVSGFDEARNVATKRDMFAGDSNLTEIIGMILDTGEVTSMRTMFDGCTNLKTDDMLGFGCK